MSAGVKVAIWVVLIVLVLVVVLLVVWWLIYGRRTKEKIDYLNSRVKELELEHEVQVIRDEQKSNEVKISDNEVELERVDKNINDLEEAAEKEKEKIDDMSVDELVESFKNNGY